MSTNVNQEYISGSFNVNVDMIHFSKDVMSNFIYKKGIGGVSLKYMFV